MADTDFTTGLKLTEDIRDDMFYRLRQLNLTIQGLMSIHGRDDIDPVLSLFNDLEHELKTYVARVEGEVNRA